jgi:hypothetical protein
MSDNNTNAPGFPGIEQQVTMVGTDIDLHDSGAAAPLNIDAQHRGVERPRWHRAGMWWC